MDNAAVVEMGLTAVAGGADGIAFAVVRLADLVGAAEAVAGVGHAVATAHRPEALALLARNAESRNGNAHALRGATHASRRLAPKPLVAHAPLGSAASLACGDGMSRSPCRQDGRGCK